MHFIRWTEEEVNENCLVRVVRNNLGPADNALNTHSFEYVTFSGHYDT